MHLLANAIISNPPDEKNLSRVMAQGILPQQIPWQINFSSLQQRTEREINEADALFIHSNSPTVGLQNSCWYWPTTQLGIVFLFSLPPVLFNRFMHGCTCTEANLKCNSAKGLTERYICVGLTDTVPDLLWHCLTQNVKLKLLDISLRKVGQSGILYFRNKSLHLHCHRLFSSAYESSV